jgi:glyoxylase-like metal-dependent hydrolase (beta-lactamase superfamily II)
MSRTDPLNPLNRDPNAGVSVNWDSGLFLLQIRAGLDCATEHSGKRAEEGLWKFAHSNANLIYIIGDIAAGEAVAVDAAYDVAGVKEIAKQSGFELIGSLYTHRHFDHCGGKVAEAFIGRAGVRVEGAAEILASGGAVWVGEGDAKGLRSQCFDGHAAAEAQLAKQPELFQTVVDGESIRPNDRWKHGIKVINTPGHTPGSVCFLIGGGKCESSFRGPVESGALLTGDTLFQGNVGRGE